MKYRLKVRYANMKKSPLLEQRAKGDETCEYIIKTLGLIYP